MRMWTEGRERSGGRAGRTPGTSRCCQNKHRMGSRAGGSCDPLLHAKAGRSGRTPYTQNCVRAFSDEGKARDKGLVFQRSVGGE